MSPQEVQQGEGVILDPGYSKCGPWVGSVSHLRASYGSKSQTLPRTTGSESTPNTMHT